MPRSKHLSEGAVLRTSTRKPGSKKKPTKRKMTATRELLSELSRVGRRLRRRVKEAL